MAQGFMEAIEGEGRNGTSMMNIRNESIEVIHHIQRDIIHNIEFKLLFGTDQAVRKC